MSASFSLHAPRTIGATWACAGDIVRHRRDRDGFALARDKFFGERHHLDHALVGFARGVAEGDDAVLAQDQPVAGLGALEDFDRLFRQAEARHHIGHEGEPPPEHLGAFFLAVRLVDHAEHRGGVGVVDEFVRQERVQHHLDRRIGRRRIDQIGALDADELVVVDGVERAQFAHRVKPHGGKPVRVDRRHVGAGGFDAQHLDVLAEAVAHARLQRGVAAAVQHELRVAAEQPRRVDAQRQIAAMSRSMPDFAPSATSASASRSTQPLFMARHDVA